MAKRKHLIIGAGSAGLNAAEEIRRISSEDEIKIVSAEDFAPYSPTALPYLLSGKISEAQLPMRKNDYFDRLKATFVRGKEVVQVLPQTREVVYRDKEREKYDSLLISAGADAIWPPIKGLDNSSCLGFHTVNDCRKLIDQLQDKNDVAILGAGLVAIEAAIGLMEKGCRVTLIVRSRILRVYFDEDAASIIKGILTANGINLLYRKEIEAVKQSGGKVQITFADGEPLTTDVLMVCTGVKARTGFLEGSGIKVNQGIVVDRSMRTNVADIYAAGDIAETPDFFAGEYGLNQIIETAMDGGKVAGSNMSGIPTDYEGWVSSNVFHFFGNNAFSAGIAMPVGDGYETVAEQDAKKAIYKKLVFRDNYLVGAMFINVDVDPGVLLYIIRKKVDAGDYKQQLFGQPREISQWLMLMAEEKEGASIQG